jgi:N-acetylglucosaminyl-diphospho-decaprenol L-rhamnosyltransferase
MNLSIAVVTYQSRGLIEPCLTSIYGADVPLPIEVLVIDNSSSDGTADCIASRFPGVRLIVNRGNEGLAKAINLAFQVSSGRYFLILNPDIEVRPGAIPALLSAMQSDPGIGLCAPTLLNIDGSLQHSCRRYYTFHTLLLRRTFLGMMFPDHEAVRHHLMMDWDHSTACEVDWVLGAALMLRREAIPNGQVMDERFFLYFEDVDLCLRLRKAGWKVMYYPEAVMVHHHQRASARVIWNRAKFEHLKSWVKFSWKHRHEPLLRLSRNKFGH